MGVANVIAEALADVFGASVQEEHRVASLAVLEALHSKRIAVIELPEVTVADDGRRTARCPLSYPRSTGREAKVVIEEDRPDARQMLASIAVPSPICPADAVLYAAALIAAERAC